MTKPTLFALALAAALAAAPPARAVIEDSYEQDTAGPPLTTWWVSADPASLRADRDYVSGMRPHHAGALSMSRGYLADPGASSPVLRVLAEAIIRNQSFEIALLDGVARDLDRPSVVLGLGPFRVSARPAATEGVAQYRRFLRSPMPSLLDGLADPGKPVTARDVQFAKAMILHHQAAVDMAQEYLANPAARNGFLGLMNIDIARDQAQEIALMRRVIALYPGNPDLVPVDASMVHGMDGMGHGAHGGMAVPAVPPAPQGQSAPQPPPPVAPAESGHARHH